jgi:hypothetical protein
LTRTGKVKSSASSRLRQNVSEFKNVFTSDHKVIFSQARRKSIAKQQRSQFAQHLNRNKNIASALGFKDRPGRPSLTDEHSAAGYP